jgi:hypothetical protein
MKAIAAVAICAVASGVVASAANAPKKPHPKPKAITLNAADLSWGDAPPQFPKGGQLAVLYGDPSKPSQYAMRFKMPDGYKIAPHWHTKDEQLTILSGTLILHMGDTMDAPAHTLTVGAYHFLPGKMHHAAEAQGEVVVEIHGIGPFDIHYLNPADDPTTSAAAPAAAPK